MSKKKEKALSPQILDFVERYVRSLNGTRAYMESHPKSGYEAARSSASRLLTNANVKEEINRRFQEKVMSREEVLYRLSDMGRASHYSFIEFADDGSVYFDFSAPEAKDHLHLIKKIKTKRNRRIEGKGEDAQTWESEWVEVELHDAKDALKLIGEHEGLFKPDEGDGEKFTAPQVVEIIKTYEEKREK